MRTSIAHRALHLTIIIAAIATTNIYSQISTGGEVVDVIDAKTLVVAVPSGRVKVELQYIDVPDPSRPLHQVVRDHLRNMLVGKIVEFSAKGFSPERTIARVMLNGIDISQQLLRDGAAWHVPIGLSGQSKFEFESYAESEMLARNEKRGVWSIEGLRTPRQERAETAAVRVTSSSEASTTRTNKRKGQWSDTNPWLKNPGGLTYGYNASTRTGFLGTTLLGVREVDSPPTRQRTAIDMSYVYTEMGEKGRRGVFVLTVMSASGDMRFLKSNTLVVEVNGKASVVGKPKRESLKDAFGSFEKLTYQVDKKVIEKIADGGEVIVKIGSYHLYPSTGLQMILHNMLQAASD